MTAELAMSAKGGAFNSRIAELRAADLIVDNGGRLSVAPEIMGGDR